MLFWGVIMGYSISVQFKSAADRAKMHQFLVDNKSLIDKLRATDFMVFGSHEPNFGEELGYAPKLKNLLGYHGTMIPTHIWNLCAWMTVKSEKNMHFFYDTEKMLVTYDTDDTKNTLVSDGGVFIEREHKFMKVSDYKAQQKILTEIDDKWRALSFTPKRPKIF